MCNADNPDAYSIHILGLSSRNKGVEEMSYRTVKNPYPFPQEDESITLQEQMENDRHHHSEKSYLLVDTPMCCEECRFYDADWCTAFGGMVRDLTDVPTDYKKADWCPLKEMPRKIGQEPYCRNLQEALFLGWDLCIKELEK